MQDVWLNRTNLGLHKLAYTSKVLSINKSFLCHFFDLLKQHFFMM